MSSQTDQRPLLSLVIPVYDESASLRQIHQEIAQVAEDLPWRIEIIFIDDGSQDDSWQTICALQDDDARITALRFRKNFGKAAALAAGFTIAKGERVCTLDADLQDDPAEIPRLLEAIDQGYDVVSGWKQERKDPWHKRLPSRVFNWMVSHLTGVRLHDHNCGFKCYRAEVLAEIQLYGEFHRFTPVLAEAKGFRVGEIVVHHRPRLHGTTKYGWERFIRGFLDLLTVKFLTAYQNRPQHLLGSLGLACFLIGLCGMGYLSVLWALMQLKLTDMAPIGSRPLLVFSATAVLLGGQMFSIGLIAELITARQQSETNVYSISEHRLSPKRRAAAKIEQT